MKFKYLVIIVVLLFQASLSYSQESLRLSLMDARAYALEYNKTMKNSNFAIDKAQYALREAISAGLPQINASADYSNALGAKISIRFRKGCRQPKLTLSLKAICT